MPIDGQRKRMLLALQALSTPTPVAAEPPPQVKFNSTSSLFIDSTITKPCADEMIFCVSIVIHDRINEGEAAAAEAASSGATLPTFDLESKALLQFNAAAGTEASDERPSEDAIFHTIKSILTVAEFSTECLVISLLFIERLRTLTGIPLLVGNSGWSKWPSWWGQSLQPRAHQTASEGLWLTSALLGSLREAVTFQPEAAPVDDFAAFDHKGNWQPILLAAMVVAQKVWDDQSLLNVDFSAICTAYTVQDINRLEKKVVAPPTALPSAIRLPCPPRPRAAARGSPPPASTTRRLRRRPPRTTTGPPRMNACVACSFSS